MNRRSRLQEARKQMRIVAEESESDEVEALLRDARKFVSIAEDVIEADSEHP